MITMSGTAISGRRSILSTISRNWNAGVLVNVWGGMFCGDTGRSW